MAATGQPLHQVEVPADERLALGATPSLDLLLEGERVDDRLELSTPDELNGAPGACVRSAKVLAVVLREALLEVDRAADVVRVVGALEDVGVRHRTSLACRGLRLDRLNADVDSGGPCGLRAEVSRHPLARLHLNHRTVVSRLSRAGRPLVRSRSSAGTPGGTRSVRRSRVVRRAGRPSRPHGPGR